MPISCPECKRLWDIFFLLSVEEFNAQEEFAAAKRENSAAEIIRGHEVRAQSMSENLAAASEQLIKHRAIHPATLRAVAVK